MMRHRGRQGTLLLFLSVWMMCAWMVTPVAFAPMNKNLSMSCPEMAAAWARWYRELRPRLLHDHDVGGQIQTPRRWNSFGCAPYQLFDDFRWVHHANASWVPRYRVRHYRQLLHRAAQNHSAIALRCRCRDPISSPSDIPLDTLRMMFYEALYEEHMVEQMLEKVEPLVELARASGRHEVLMVGNSAALQDPGVPPRGEIIDSYPVVVRFNLRWREDVAPFVGWKRDVWIANDYHDTCGCLTSECCTPEQEKSLWEIIGGNCSIVFGKTPPPGLSKPDHANVRFACFGTAASTINYWLWIHGMQHPEFQTLLSPILHTRTGLQTIFISVAAGLKTTVVGFDVGGGLHKDLYQVIDEKEGKSRAYKPLRKFKSETVLLSELVKAGLLHVMP